MTYQLEDKRLIAEYLGLVSKGDLDYLPYAVWALVRARYLEEAIAAKRSGETPINLFQTEPAGDALLCNALDSLVKLTRHIDASYTGKERDYQVNLPIFTEAHARIGALRQHINLMREGV